MDNNIKIKDILGMKFFIPSYQRGYRWTEQQVNDLLNDINEFINHEIVKGSSWYCLQPLVVRKMEERDERLSSKKDRKDWYEVIDGQQRLTTIYILLYYLYTEGDKLYTLSYETRKGFSSFLDKIKNIDVKGVCDINNLFDNIVKKEREWNNIDFYHVIVAYVTINKWFSVEGRTDIKDKFLDNVKFIWYESDDEDPIKVFTRLNIGKISLTNAELIKALFLNKSNFNTANNNHLKLRQQEISSEWDNIEYTLQNDEFWLFLKKTGYSRPTRIDFIFDLICNQNQLDLSKDKLERIGNDEYRTFRYFYEYYKEKADIDFCWKTVKDYFQTFMEWYNDLQLYHYVGYLLENKDEKLPDLVKEWNEAEDKNSFISYLKTEIKNIINKCPKLDYQYKEDGDDKRKCKPILLFHNIQTVINQNASILKNDKYQSGVFYKFPFHLYKLESWDVEHIDSNTTNEESDKETQIEWLLNVYLGAKENVQKKICSYFDSKEDNKDALFKEIKKDFPTRKEWKLLDKNKIGNYALLDTSTNRSYGNAIFSAKRRIIIGKDKGKLIFVPKINKDGKLQIVEDTEATSSFVPPCTKQVFMKYFSAAMSDFNYWTKADAEAYLNDIRNCINQLES